MRAQAEYTVPTGKRKCPYGGIVFNVKIKYPSTYPFKNPDVRVIRAVATPIA